ncbi:S-adenosyl-L-methionine-dependent methyltransferase [Wilcoxina mikolae CBS 423.85]|nr:S-adenosyl-L-methionine-dependent methyltransferase [Wilcoxina mikolae CBS 423.85]
MANPYIHTQAAIEVDPAVLEDDLTEDYLSTGYDTSTASLSESVNEYVFENGRRYHIYFGPDKNPHPTDEMEQDRLDLQHEMFYILLGKELHIAPLTEPHRILDVGTGTGIWAIDMADKYPMAEVIGLDLSPIQPAWVPPNCRFEVDDAELDWTYSSDHFDFIHARDLGQAVSDWPKLLSQAYRCTKPGGYIELSEADMRVRSDNGTLAKSTGITRYIELIMEGMAKRNLAYPHETLKEDLKNAGFVDIEVIEKKLPLGPWPKDPELKKAGAMALLAGETGYHTYGMQVFTRALNMTLEEADQVCRGAYLCVSNKNNHVYCTQ